MPKFFHQNDIGATLRITVTENGVAVDISGNTKIDVVVSKPGNPRVAQVYNGSLTTNGLDGTYEYVFQAGELDILGRWRFQGDLALPAWEGRTVRDFVDVLGTLPLV